MKKRLVILPILVTVIFSVLFVNVRFLPVASATYVEGPVTKDTVWTLVESPFIVSQDVTVYSNATLTIEPGVEVRFGGAFSLIVYGKLYADGTNKTIKFTSNKGSPSFGDWESIQFRGAQKSTFMNCFVAYAVYGIFVGNGVVEVGRSTLTLSIYGANVTNGRAFIHDSVLTENRDNGIAITGLGQVNVDNNTITANSNGILLTGSSISNVMISQNRISANKNIGTAIDAATHSNITITDNQISSNAYGLYISSPTSTFISGNSISYNNVGVEYDKGNHVAAYNDIYGNALGMDVLLNSTVEAEHNYWGDPSGPYHASLNPNGLGNPVGGDGINLNFIFFLFNPIGHINSPPTADLFMDKSTIRSNDDVMFFATNSYDADGRVDKYRYDFGDGNTSGWTTVSIFTHKYPTLGTYYARLTVMDDYGTTSNAVNTTVRVRNLQPLYVTVELGNSTVREGGQVSVRTQVTNGIGVVENATVTLFSVKGGNFAQSIGSTNTSGYFVTAFTAPDVVDVSHVRIIARASGNGYTDAAEYAYVEVSPSLSVRITTLEGIVSEETAALVVYVESNGQPVANATVSALSTGGSLSPETRITYSNGTASFAFTAPETTSPLNVTVTGVATKSKFITGTVQTEITVEPRVPVVQITAASPVVVSEGQLNMTVNVKYGIVPLVLANVTITASNGSFPIATGLTNIYGNATFTFVAPVVNNQFNVTITARAVLARYAEGQGQSEVTVNPKTFNVQISASAIGSGESAVITVHVACKEDITDVAEATVTVFSNGGSFVQDTKTTDTLGTSTFTFNAPQTSSDLPVTIIANVTKNGYTAGGSNITITVTPESTAPSEGWPLTTLLLIIIPIVIVVIVLVLVKLKVISFSGEEEEQS
jgi:parallel beta-helix repeat protein